MKACVLFIACALISTSAYGQGLFQRWREARSEAQEAPQATVAAQAGLPGCCAQAGPMQAPAAAPATTTPNTAPAANPTGLPAAPKPAKAYDPFTPQSQNDGYRPWTGKGNITGFDYTVRAKFVSLRNGQVRLLKDNGKYTNIDLDKLVPEDRKAAMSLAEMTVALQ